MIRIAISRDQNGSITATTVRGHSGFADAGSDIVCAAVSILIQNAVNSVEALCGVVLDTESRDGFVSLHLHAHNDRKDVQLLLESMVLGMRGISEEYPGFVQVREQMV